MSESKQAVLIKRLHAKTEEDGVKWDETEKAKVEAYNVFDDLRVTAPVLVVLPSEEHFVGYLAIKHALENGGIR